MEQLIERCAGLDVHKDTVAVCVHLSEPGGKKVQEIQTFGTMTPDLLALRDWLESLGVTHVAMESTGVNSETRLLHSGRGIHRSSLFSSMRLISRTFRAERPIWRIAPGSRSFWNTGVSREASCRTS